MYVRDDKSIFAKIDQAKTTKDLAMMVSVLNRVKENNPGMEGTIMSWKIIIFIFGCTLYKFLYPRKLGWMIVKSLVDQCVS